MTEYLQLGAIALNFLASFLCFFVCGWTFCDRKQQGMEWREWLTLALLFNLSLGVQLLDK